jgi:hypothetical protein
VDPIRKRQPGIANLSFKVYKCQAFLSLITPAIVGLEYRATYAQILVRSGVIVNQVDCWDEQFTNSDHAQHFLIS